jgi:acylphosphatase
MVKKLSEILKKKLRPRLKKILIGLILFFVVFTLVGFFGLPPILKSILTKKLSENLHRSVTINQIKINPYALSIAVRGLTVKDKDSSETFVSCEEIFLNLQSLSALRKALILSEIRLKQPFIKITQHADRSYNFSDLIEKKETKPPEKEKSKPLNFSLNNIKIENGSIDFLDESKQKKHTVRELNIGVPFLSNIHYYVETYVQPSFSAKINGTPYTIQGKTKPFADSRESSFDINIDDLDIPYYLAYVPTKMNFKIVSAFLDTQLRISFIETKDKKPSVTVTGNVSLKKIAVDDGRKKSLLRLPLFDITIAPSEPLSKGIHLSKVSIQSPELEIRRDEKGRLNVSSLLPEKKERKPIPEKAMESAPFSLEIDEMQMTGGKISFSDHTPSGPVTITAKNFDLRVENISTAKNSKSKLSLSLLLDKKGKISTTGSIGIDPITAELKMDMKGIEIGSFQSYFTDKVKVAVTGGAFSTTGNLSLGIAGNKEVKATYRGNAALSNFSSIDKASAEDFLKWDSLSFSGLNVGYSPLSIDIKGIALTDFYSRVIINPQGTLNLQEIVAKGEQEKEAPPPAQTQEKVPESQKNKGSANKIKIGTVTLQGGKVDFSDRSVNPEYSTRLVEIGGRISGLSSEETTLADVDLRGKLDDYAPLEITGKINPLKDDLYVDIKARFKDMELNPTTPYAWKYVGYTIEKGKLSLDLKYLIVKKKLESQNYIFLNQLTLGDKVESPHATKLPVKLAIALLKDRTGEIKLDIPVTGSLDDPKFSVWGIILKILINLLARAATSPFSLLGALFGGGEELSFVEFDYGSTVIAEQNMKKIDTLMKALHDRPALKLDIEGHVDLEKDKDGLIQYLFNKKLKAQKLKEMVKNGQPAIAVDEVKIEPAEYGKYLKMAYKEEKFPKPSNFLGMAKDLPVPETEKLMLTHIEIKEGDLRTLASQRSMRVKDVILISGQVEPERVFILEPKSLAPEKKEKVKDSRVDFKLK